MSSKTEKEDDGSRKILEARFSLNRIRRVKGSCRIFEARTWELRC